MNANFRPVFFNNMLNLSWHQFWPSFQCLCSLHIPRTWATHLRVLQYRNGVLFIKRLVDSSPNVTFTVCLWPKSVLVSSFQMTFFQSLCQCWLAYCMRDTVLCGICGHCSQFFFKCLLASWNSLTTFFFQRVLYVSWSYWWFFSCILKTFPGSCCWNFGWSVWPWFDFNRIPHFPLLN